MAEMTAQYGQYSEKSLAVDGAATVTDITVTGIAANDVLISCWHWPAAGTPVDAITDETSITAANTIQCSTTVTTGGRLLVRWLDRNL